LFTDAIGALETAPFANDRALSLAHRQLAAHMAECSTAQMTGLRVRLWTSRGAGPAAPEAKISTASFMRSLLDMQGLGEAEVGDDQFLERVASTGDPQDYASLGAYVFDDNPVLFSTTSGAAPIPQLVQLRSGVSDDALKAYLENAASHIRTAAYGEPDPEAQAWYELGVALLQQIQAYEPSLAPDFTAAMNKLSSALGAGLSNDEALLHAAADPSLEDEWIRRAGDLVEEDNVRLRLIRRHWSSYQTKRMRELAAGINDPALAQKLDALITYSETVANPEAAARLRPSTKSSLVWLSRNDVNQAVRDVQYAGVGLRPVLYLAAARAAIESPSSAADKAAYALRLLGSAVGAFNDGWAARDEDSVSSAGGEEMAGWDEIVRTSNTACHFPLGRIIAVGGVDLKTSLTALAAREPDRVEVALRDLREEWVEAESLTHVM